MDEQQQRLLQHLLTQSVGSDVSAPPGYSTNTSSTTGYNNYGSESNSYYNYYQGYSDSGISYGGLGSYNMTNYSLDESLYQRHKSNKPDTSLPPPGLNPYANVNGFNYNQFYNNFDQFNDMLQGYNSYESVPPMPLYDDAQSTVVNIPIVPDTEVTAVTQQNASIPTEVASQYKNNKKSETLFNFLKKNDSKDSAASSTTPITVSPLEQQGHQPSAIVADKSKSDLLKKMLLGGVSAPAQTGTAPSATPIILSRNSENKKKAPSSNNAAPVNVPKKPVNYADVLMTGAVPTKEQSVTKEHKSPKTSQPAAAPKASQPAKGGSVVVDSKGAAKGGNVSADSKGAAKGSSSKSESKSAAPVVKPSTSKTDSVRKSDEKKKENHSSNLKSSKPAQSNIKKVPSGNFATSVTLTAPDPVNIPLPEDW